jgi:hypothetical protein
MVIHPRINTWLPMAGLRIRCTAGHKRFRCRSVFWGIFPPPSGIHEFAHGSPEAILERNWAAAADEWTGPPTSNCVRDVEGATVEETANILGIKAETVRTRLHRARNMLRDRLGEEFAAVLKDVFPFERPRCDALVSRLLCKVGLLRAGQAKG